LKSEQGAGKNIIFDLLKQIVGDHLIPVDSLNTIFESYNDHIAHGIMLLFDEVIYGNSKKQAQNLKKLITSNEMEFRQKYVSIVTVKNLANCFILSNHFKVLHIEAGCRRLGVFECCNMFRRMMSGYKADQGQLDNYFTTLASVPPAAILQYLLDIDLTNFDPTIIPNTQERIDMMKECLDDIQQWILHIIEDVDEKQWCDTELFESDVWNHFVSYMKKPAGVTKSGFFTQLKRYQIRVYRPDSSQMHNGIIMNRPRKVIMPSKRVLKDSFLSVLGLVGKEAEDLVFDKDLE
jgi:hypothetical protein